MVHYINWAIGLFLVFLSLLFFAWQGVSALVNDNQQYKDYILSYFAENYDVEVVDLHLDWEKDSPLVLLEGISWQGESGEEIYLAQGALSLNLGALFYDPRGILVISVSDGQLMLPSQEYQLAGEANLFESLADLNLNVRMQNFDIMQSSQQELFVKIVNQRLKLRQGRLRGSLEGFVTSNDLDLLDFEVVLRYGYGDGVYLKLQDMEFEEGWQQILAAYDDILPARILEASEQLTSFSGDGELWLTLYNNFYEDGEQSNRADIALQAELNDVSLSSNMTLNNLDFTIGLFFEAEQNLLIVNEFAFDLDAAGDTDYYEFTDLEVVQTSGDIEIAISSIYAEDASKLALQLLPPGELMETIKAHDPRGLVKNLYIKIAEKSNFADDTTAENQPRVIVEAELNDLGISPRGKTPGMSSINGWLNVRDNHGWFLLDNDKTDLIVPGIYYEPLDFGYARGVFLWEWLPEETEIVLVGETSIIQSGNMVGDMQIELASIPFVRSFMDLSVSMEGASLEQTRNFIAWGAFDPAASRWLNASLIEGEDTDMVLSLSGDLQNFAQPSSVFELGVSMQNVGLLYAQSEEPIRAPQFDVFLDRDTVEVFLPKGGTIGEAMTVDNSYGITEIRNGNFALGGAGQVHLEYLPQALSSYVLGGDDLPFVSAGDAIGNWEFRYNLVDRNFQGADFDLRLQQGELAAESNDEYKISNIRGDLGFSSSEGYSGEWTGVHKGNRIAGKFSSNRRDNLLVVSGEVPIPDRFSPEIEGATNVQWTAKTPEKGSLFFSEFMLESDLRGVAINLPDPFQKNQAAAQQLRMIWQQDRGAAKASLTMGDDLQAKWLINGGEMQGASLAMPALDTDSNSDIKVNPGLEVNINRKIDLSPWVEHGQELLADNNLAKSIQATETRESILWGIPKTLYDAVAQSTEFFDLWNLQFSDLEMDGNSYQNIGITYNAEQESTGPLSKRINFTFDTPDSLAVDGGIWTQDDTLVLEIQQLNVLVGEIDQFGEDLPAANLTGYIGYLDSLPDELHPPTQLADMPKIQVGIDELRYNDELIGNINLLVEPEDDQLKISLQESSALGLSGTGNFLWQMPADDESSIELALNFNGDLPRGNVDGLSANDASLDFTWQWQGANQDFGLWQETATSSLNIESSRGYVVSDRVSLLTNLISFFNINNLVGRFRGDFSDISLSELSYRDAKLDMTLSEQGYVISDDSTIVFSFVDIDFNGIYDVAKDNLDVDVIVTSPTSRVLPLTALIIGSPALLPIFLSVDAAGGEFLNRFSSGRYEVTGPLANPEVVLRGIGDLSGGEILPDDLVNRANVQGVLNNIDF